MNARSAKEVEFFPYTSKLLCYILVKNDNTVTQPCHYVKPKFGEIVNVVKSKEW